MIYADVVELLADMILRHNLKPSHEGCLCSRTAWSGRSPPTWAEGLQNYIL
jgi:hypothetical protein